MNPWLTNGFVPSSALEAPAAHASLEEGATVTDRQLGMPSAQLTHHSAAGMSFTLRTVDSSIATGGEASALTSSAPR